SRSLHFLRALRIRMVILPDVKNLIGHLRFVLVRGLERRLPIRWLRWALTPVAFVRSLFQKSDDPVAMPACLGTGASAARESTTAFLNRALEFFPDRLAEARGSER